MQTSSWCYEREVPMLSSVQIPSCMLEKLHRGECLEHILRNCHRSFPMKQPMIAPSAGPDRCRRIRPILATTGRCRPQRQGISVFSASAATSCLHRLIRSDVVQIFVDVPPACDKDHDALVESDDCMTPPSFPNICEHFDGRSVFCHCKPYASAFHALHL